MGDVVGAELTDVGSVWRTNDSSHAFARSRVRAVAQARGLRGRTAKIYRAWIVRFVRFCGLRHPATLGASDIARFLGWIVDERRARPSTVAQARAALMFLYRDVLEVRDVRVPPVVREGERTREPATLTSDELSRFLSAIAPPHRLAASLLCGAGLRLMECLTLRVRDIDLARRRIHVRGVHGAGRFTILPERLVPAIVAQIDLARRLHGRDAQRGGGFIELPVSGDESCSSVVRNWRWTWLFPAARQRLDRATGQRRRQHVVATTLQRAIAKAGRDAGLERRVTPRTLRHSFARELLRHGADVRVVQELLGHRDVTTTAAYLRAVDSPSRTRSPLDGLAGEGVGWLSARTRSVPEHHRRPMD